MSDSDRYDVPLGHSLRVRDVQALLDSCRDSMTPRYSVADCQPSQHALFADYSLDRDRALLVVPVFAGHPEFRAEAFDLLKSAHETVKQRLKLKRAAERTSTDPR